MPGFQPSGHGPTVGEPCRQAEYDKQGTRRRVGRIRKQFVHLPRCRSRLAGRGRRGACARGSRSLLGRRSCGCADTHLPGGRGVEREAQRAGETSVWWSGHFGHPGDPAGVVELDQQQAARLALRRRDVSRLRLSCEAVHLFESPVIDPYVVRPAVIGDGQVVGEKPGGSGQASDRRRRPAG